VALLEEGLELSAMTDIPIPPSALTMCDLARAVIAMRKAFIAKNAKQAGELGAAIVAKFSVRDVRVWGGG
jgi:hypothetical protein